MKFLFVLVTLVLASGFLFAGISPLPKPVKTTFIMNCAQPYAITKPGTYVVYNNLTTSAAYCIRIDSSNVTLDCNGRTLAGQGSTNAIVFSNFSATHSNIVVKNCIIRNFIDAIAGMHANNVAIRNNTIYSDSQSVGISLSGISGLAVANNSISNAGGFHALYIYASHGAVLTGNTVLNASSNGLVIGSSSSTMIAGNAISAQNGAALWCTACHGANISGNKLTGNYSGLVLNYANGALVSGNAISSNNTGVLVQNSKNNFVYGNNIKTNMSGASSLAIRLSETANNTFLHNNISFSGSVATNFISCTNQTDRFNDSTSGNIYYYNGAGLWDIYPVYSTNNDSWADVGNCLPYGGPSSPPCVLTPILAWGCKDWHPYTTLSPTLAAKK